MAYGGRTRFYQIPYMVTDDFMTQDEEKRRAAIIDSLLFVATYGATKAIIEDASYAVSNPSENPCTLTISPTGTSYTLIAVLNGRLAFRTDTIRLPLVKGFVYYVSCGYTTEMETNPEACRIAASTERTSDASHILLCTVDLTGDEPVIDADADKQYLRSIAAHTMDSTNPHGAELSQSTLRVNHALYVNDQEMLPAVYHDIESSPGTAAATVKIDGMTPVFVTPMISDAAVGRVVCTINGDDTISVTNDGATGLPIRLKIEGRYSI